MGQTPSCRPHADVDRKRPSLAAPLSQRMSFSLHSLASPHHSTSPTQTSTPSLSQAPGCSPSPPSLSLSPASPPSPLSLKSLTINPDLPTTAPSTHSPPHTLLSFLRAKASSHKKDRRPFLVSTPKGADAVAFPHLCPICYRHFPDVLLTTCCQQNVCAECVERYLEMRGQRWKGFGLDGRLFLVACPTCNQHNGVVFEKLKTGQQGHVYVESPRTKQLLQRAEEAASAARQDQWAMPTLVV